MATLVYLCQVCGDYIYVPSNVVTLTRKCDKCGAYLSAPRTHYEFEPSEITIRCVPSEEHPTLPNGKKYSIKDFPGYLEKLEGYIEAVEEVLGGKVLSCVSGPGFKMLIEDELVNVPFTVVNQIYLYVSD